MVHLTPTFSAQEKPRDPVSRSEVHICTSGLMAVLRPADY
jgi:hypothetical protein